MTKNEPEKIAKEKSSIQTQDGHRIYYETYKPSKSRAALLFVHGLGEHCGRYHNPVNYFAAKQFNIYLFDHRGHGRSDGLRSYIDNFDTYLNDLDAFVRFVNHKEKNKKIFLVGHSMGGQIAINYAAKYQDVIAGLITSSANIEMAVKIPWLKRFMGMNLAKVLPKFSLENEIDPKWISRDKEVVRAYKADPFVSKAITLNLASEILLNQKNILNLASQIHIPALIMHGGDDHICASHGSEDFYKELNSSDKTLKIYDGFYHEIFNELGKQKVFSDMEAWLKKHLTN